MPPRPALPAVLLVEDDPTNQLVALSMLRHLGLDADVAADGRAGVRRVTERDYDVVLMDVQMPVMDGVEAMRAIRTLIPLDRCPRIVAVTAHAVAGTRERLLAAGFDGFYNKPLSIGVVREAVGLVPAPPAVDPSFVARAPSPTQAADDARATAALLACVRAHVREMLGEDDEAFVADLVGAFTESSRQAVAEVADARAADDADGVARAAHKMKGSASSVGLSDLTERWDRVETALRGGAALEAGALDQAVAETTGAVALLDLSLV